GDEVARAGQGRDADAVAVDQRRRVGGPVAGVLPGHAGQRSGAGAVLDLLRALGLVEVGHVAGVRLPVVVDSDAAHRAGDQLVDRDRPVWRDRRDREAIARAQPGRALLGDQLQVAGLADVGLVGAAQLNCPATTGQVRGRGAVDRRAAVPGAGALDR